MYEKYLEYILEITKSDISNINFKCNLNYNSILEHVSYEQGKEYISNIVTFFPDIKFENIEEFVTINDKFGNPNKYEFNYLNNCLICSPTSLRYVFHSLIILKYYENRNVSKNIVEVGCGYGGLFLSICYFSKLLSIQINHYYLIDLPEIGCLIQKYLELHNLNANISYSVHSAYDYGKDILNNNLFLISNYCFTEISNEKREKYISTLFPKVNSGFIIWQTIFSLPITNLNIIKKNIIKIEEECPQTATVKEPNYFVYF
jgi:hypothetical protein